MSIGRLLAVSVVELRVRMCPFSKAPGDRDFVWFTLFLALLTTLSLLSVIIHHGLFVRLPNDLLGGIEGAGIPMQVNTDIYAGTSYIDRAIVDRFADGHGPSIQRPESVPPDRTDDSDVDLAGMRLFPVRVLALDHDVMRLPESGLWKDRNTEPMQGWAVFGNHPLWRRALGPDAGPGPSTGFDIVLNRSLLDSFDVEKYRALLDPNGDLGAGLPVPYRENPIDPAAGTAGADAGNLMMELDFGLHRFADAYPNAIDLKMRLPVRVHLVDSLPIPGRVGFLIGLDLMHLATISQREPSLVLFPEGGGAVTGRVVDAYVVGRSTDAAAEAAVDKAASAFRECMAGEVAEGSDGRQVYFRTPVPRPLLDDCAARAGLTELADLDLSCVWSDAYAIGEDLRARVSRLDPDDPSARAGDCREPPAATGPVDEFDLLEEPGEIQATVYFASRTDIYETAKSVLRLAAVTHRQGGDGQGGIRYVPAFWLDPSYASAVERFGYLTKVIELLSGPALIIGVIISITLVVLQLGVMLSHRVRQSALFLAAGFSATALLGAFAVQVLFMGGVGFVLGSLTTWGICEVSNKVYWSSNAYEIARDALGMVDPVFLRLPSWEIFAGVLLGILALVYVLAVLMMLFKGLISISRTVIGDPGSPASLLKDG